MLIFDYPHNNADLYKNKIVLVEIDLSSKKKSVSKKLTWFEFDNISDRILFI